MVYHHHSVDDSLFTHSQLSRLCSEVLRSWSSVNVEISTRFHYLNRQHSKMSLFSWFWIVNMQLICKTKIMDYRYKKNRYRKYRNIEISETPILMYMALCLAVWLERISYSPCWQNENSFNTLTLVPQWKLPWRFLDRVPVEKWPSPVIIV